jgi:hypothetical protein
MSSDDTRLQKDSHQRAIDEEYTYKVNAAMEQERADIVLDLEDTYVVDLTLAAEGGLVVR